MFVLANYSVILLITFFVATPAIFLASVVFMLFALIAFNKHKNLVLDTLGLKTGSYVITNSFLLFRSMTSFLHFEKRPGNRFII